MSAWKAVARAMYDMGPCTATALAEATCIEVSRSLKWLKQEGMAITDGRRGAPGGWILTPKGVAWCEGRLTLAPKPWRGTSGRPALRFVATWLAAWPGRVSINKGNAAPPSRPDMATAWRAM